MAATFARLKCWVASILACINDIVHRRSAMTAAIALRPAKYFGMTPEL